MKFVLFFSVLALFVCTSYAIPPAGVVQFIVGFAEGIETEVSENITQCVVDYNASLDDLDRGFAELDEGFKKLHPALVEQGLSDIGKGIQEIAGVLDVCGLNELALEIAHVGKEIEEGKLLEVILKETINIIHNERVLTSDFKSATAAWMSKDYKTSGLYLGKIVGILLKV